jgi:3-hydroxyacyl-[acyl-carrier-protein] dehydratase
MPPPPLFALARLDPEHAYADLETIRRYNPHRFEMELLTRICHFDLEAQELAAVYDVPREPFWARGHIPDRPIMPGVLLIEAAAQMCSYAVHRAWEIQGIDKEGFFGFGGIDDVKFRGIVFPGDRLLILGKPIDVRPRRAVFLTQGFVEGSLVFEASITGMWI